jgi:hypothetical protein
MTVPSNDEIATQKLTAYAALSSFHEMLSLPNVSSLMSLLSLLSRRAEYWLCINRAMLYNVPLDPAASIGITRPYRCTVSVMVDIDVDGGKDGGRGSFGRRRGRGRLRIEACGNNPTDLSHGGGGCIEDAMPFVRLLSLGANVNANPIDGSYSLDEVVVVDRLSSDDDNNNDNNGNGGQISPLPLLPSWMTGERGGQGGCDSIPTSFLVEHKFQSVWISEFQSEFQCIYKQEPKFEPKLQSIYEQEPKLQPKFQSIW